MNKHWITISQLQGHIAMWAVRLSPYHNPDGLGQVLDAFRAFVRHQFDANEMKLVDAKDIREMLEVHLLSIPQVQLWNERKNGNKAPYSFCSRYDKPRPDDDFIDLYALINNIGRTTMQECRAEAANDVRPRTRFERFLDWIRSFRVSYPVVTTPPKQP